VSWRADPTEPGFYLRKLDLDQLEVVEVAFLADGRGGERGTYTGIGAEEFNYVEPWDRFLGPFALAELEAFLLGRGT
jgi:hypothetical protein